MGQILVTGATGCLGAEITRQLLAAGQSVLAQGRDARIGQRLSAEGARFLTLDLTSPAALRPHLAGIDTIYHCAALSSAWGPAAAFQALNVEATARLLAAAREAGVSRFIFASSPSICSDGSHRLNLTESAPLPLRQFSHYSRTKAVSEAMVRQADMPGAMRCVALRPRAIYGHGDRALMPRLLQALQRGKVPLIDAGQALIDLTHVSDAARAMILAAQQAGPAGGQVFNISSGEPWRFVDLLDQICAHFGLSPKRIPIPYRLALTLGHALETCHRLFRPDQEPLLTRQAVIALGRSMTLNLTAAREQLGYRPQVGLREGIRDYTA
ncbi:NAD-dependent epimerase/dehydratase family protein [Pseudogemmobacter faecipullorum]|uniref:NAD-dependent epimerase/dehydratase family protein n=1 Tax=Pseudogemmobacter faecipullorum TaxID=2755041 RepID=A0ABS8CPU9_9RHOB|nr:NAD-dependent epimerase/dehydratase family protein [Pseudogemmobacter faecipullorum]MCB5411417.1 NAD-dependent epimerase/dehydratase family protein [Pseudogemmobacter faecipullorum]